VRLKKQWAQDYREWAKRDLTGIRYVYFWADGIYFNVRLEDTENKRQCFLIIIGAREDGTKELVAVLDGYRESKLSWMELLSSLKERGLSEGPKRGHWRRRSRLLGGPAGSLSRYEGTAVLGSQDCQRSG